MSVTTSAQEEEHMLGKWAHSVAERDLVDEPDHVSDLLRGEAT